MTHTAERDRGEREPNFQEIYDNTWNEAYRRYRRNNPPEDSEDYADRKAEAAREEAYRSWYKKSYGKIPCPREF